MTIIYVHGVKVREERHGVELGRSFERWLRPKLSVNDAAPSYEPVYWGDLAATFAWDLASRPRTKLLRMGGQGELAGLGSLRGATADTPLDLAVPAAAPIGPVLGAPTASAPQGAPPLATIPSEARADFVADLYLACAPTKDGEDPVVDEPTTAGLAVAAQAVADRWDAIAAAEQSDDARASRLVAEVDARLKGEDLIGMGGFADWMTRAGEVVRRAAAWPGDAVGTVLGEGRPVANDFVAHFIGDVLTYIARRGNRTAPGEIPKRLLVALRRAQERKKETGERIVVVSHSMGGQLVYDALNHFAEGDRTLDDLEVDHWFTCGSQVSLFAEMRLLLDQPQAPGGAKLPMPRRVKAWTNYYDTNDLVGFVMEPVFQGPADLEYNTGYGLAFAHTGFLARPSFFKAMADRL